MGPGDCHPPWGRTPIPTCPEFGAMDSTLEVEFGETALFSQTVKSPPGTCMGQVGGAGSCVRPWAGKREMEMGRPVGCVRLPTRAPTPPQGHFRESWVEWPCTAPLCPGMGLPPLQPDSSAGNEISKGCHFVTWRLPTPGFRNLP